MSPLKKLFLFIGFLSIIATGIYFSWQNFGPISKNTSLLYVKEQGVPELGGPFQLRDQNGIYRTNKEFNGKILLVYFGYSYCPDICPTALSNISQALKSLGKNADYFQPLFITIDPNRDTQELLKTYMQDFDPHFIALTGTEEELLPLKKAYKVYASKAPSSIPQDPHYLVDHSSLIYVMDPKGKYIMHFSHQTDPVILEKSLKGLLNQYYPN